MGEYDNKIKKLERTYSETNVAKGEVLKKDTISQINQTYNRKLQKRRVDSILSLVFNRDSIKEEVHDIVDDYGLKELCKNCKEELIISCIILYVTRSRNTNYRIENSPLWKKYGLDWKKYSLIVSKISMKAREERKIRTNKYYIDNEDLVRW